MDTISVALTAVRLSPTHIDETREEEALPLLRTRGIDSAIGDSDDSESSSTSLVRRHSTPPIGFFALPASHSLAARSTSVPGFLTTDYHAAALRGQFTDEYSSLQGACENAQEKLKALSAALEKSWIKPIFVGKEGLKVTREIIQFASNRVATVATAAEGVFNETGDYAALTTAIEQLGCIDFSIPKIPEGGIIKGVILTLTPVAMAVWGFLCSLEIAAALPLFVTGAHYILGPLVAFIMAKSQMEILVAKTKAEDRIHIQNICASSADIFKDIQKKMSDLTINATLEGVYQNLQATQSSASHALAAAEHSSAANNGIARLEQENARLQEQLTRQAEEAKAREERIVKETVKEMLASLGIGSSIAIPSQGVGNSPSVTEPAGLASSVSSNESSASANTTSSAQDLA